MKTQIQSEKIKMAASDPTEHLRQLSNDYEKIMLGKDPQLELAVKELLKEAK